MDLSDNNLYNNRIKQILVKGFLRMSDYSDIRCMIQELANGTEEAWSHFIKHYGRLIYCCINKAMNYRVSQENLDDCFQEILRILLEDDCRRLKKVRALEEKTFRSWLSAAATRRTFNFFRDIKESFQLPEEIMCLIPATSSSPEMEAFRIQLMEVIRKKLDFQEGLVLQYFLDGLTLAEIAERMDLGTTSIYNIKQRAIAEIKRILRLDEKKGE